MSAPPQVALAECCEVVGGGTPRTSDPDAWGGDIAWATPKDLSDSGERYIGTTRRNITTEGLRRSGARVLPPGSVLLSSRAPIGLVAINTVPMATNQGFKSLVPDPGRADAGYLAHWLRANTARLQGLGNGATFKEVSKSIVSNVRVPLPDLDEQRRIARVLDAADQVRAKRREAIACGVSLPYSSLTASSPDLTGELVETCPLDSLVASGDRINYGVVQPGSQIEGGVPLIRAGDLVGGGIRRDGLRTIDPSVDAAYRRSRIRGNEVLLSCVGSVGVVARTTQEDVGSNIVRAVTRVPIESPNLRTYVAAYLETPTAQRYFTAELRTVAQPTLNIKQIRALPIPRPTDGWLERFAGRAKLIEQTSRRQIVHLAQLDTLFASLQSRAFAGEL